MPDLMVKDQIKKLVELQKLDGEIYNLQKDKEEKPRLIEQLKQEFESKKTTLLGLENKLKGLQLQRKDCEVELQTKESQIAKCNADLSQIKTNKEYTAKLTETESLKADKSIIEEKILNLYDSVDQVTAEVQKEKLAVQEEDKKFNEGKRKIEEETKLLDDRIRVLTSQRQQNLSGVDPNVLNRYEKILSHKEGVAIVPVQGNACGGCFMNVTTQTINEIKMNQSLVECEKCSRILYIEDDL